MVYAATTVSAAEQAARARDVPNLVANNVLERYVALPQWRVSGSWASGTDISDNDTYPVWRAFDRQAHLYTQPTTVNGETEVSFLLDLTAGTTDADTIDSAFVVGHNFHLLGGNLSVTLDISDVNTFSGADPSTLTLVTWTNPTTSQRFGTQNFVTTQARYTSVRYLRLRIRKTSGTFSSVIPKIGELWIGRRRQLGRFPKTPWDEASTQSSFADFVADGGTRVRYAKNRGGRVLEPSFWATTSDGGIDTITTLRAWWNDCEQGTKASLFVESPFTVVYNLGESTTIVYPEDQRFNMPLVGPFEREVSLRLIESAPFLLLET